MQTMKETKLYEFQDNSAWLAIKGVVRRGVENMHCALELKRNTDEEGGKLRGYSLVLTLPGTDFGANKEQIEIDLDGDEPFLTDEFTELFKDDAVSVTELLQSLMWGLSIPQTLEHVIADRAGRVVTLERPDKDVAAFTLQIGDQKFEGVTEWEGVAQRLGLK